MSKKSERRRRIAQQRQREAGGVPKPDAVAVAPPSPTPRVLPLDKQPTVLRRIIKGVVSVLLAIGGIWGFIEWFSKGPLLRIDEGSRLPGATNFTDIRLKLVNDGDRDATHLVVIGVTEGELQNGQTKVIFDANQALLIEGVRLKSRDYIALPTLERLVQVSGFSPTKFRFRLGFMYRNAFLGQRLKEDQCVEVETDKEGRYHWRKSGCEGLPEVDWEAYEQSAARRGLVL